MKNIVILLAIILLSCKDSTSTAADIGVDRMVPTIVSNPEQNSDTSVVVTNSYYKGTLNGTIKISLYINEQEHPCGGDMTLLNAMYKYDSQEKWILLNTTLDRKKENFCMVEDNFSGVLFLEKNENSLNGKWISPDTTKQFEVSFEKEALDKTTNEALEEILFDDLLYNKNDC